MAGALEGVRVVELAIWAAAPGGAGNRNADKKAREQKRKIRMKVNQIRRCIEIAAVVFAHTRTSSSFLF